MSAARRNPLTGEQPLYVQVLAVISGFLAGYGGAAPTGSAAVDTVLVAVSAAAVTWAAATAPWWAIAATCGVAAAFSTNPLMIAIALVGVGIAGFIGVKQRNLPWARALAALLAVQVLTRIGNVGFLGLSAIIACATLSALFVIGLRRRPSKVRRTAYIWLGGVAAIMVVAVIGLALAALSARAPLQEANRQAKAGLKALNLGDIPGAAKAFQAAETSFRSAADDLDAIWAQPGRVLPVVAQNRKAAIDLAEQGAGAMSVAATALAQVDPESLRVVAGQIDLDAVRALAEPFTDLGTAIDGMQSTIEGLSSQWLITPLQDRLSDLSDDLVENKVRADNALLAVQLAPDMLGGTNTRRYFIAFTTPAEARGGGGFMGNYAEITIDNGRISMSAFGRHTDLTNGGADPEGKVLTGPDEFLKRWGRFGFVETDGTVGPDAWRQITMAPDFPLTADVIARLYPQSGGREIDGVFSMDPQVLAAIVGLTGPLRVEGVNAELTAANLAEFVLRGQYDITANGDRIELLDVIAETAVQKLLSRSLPPPAELAKVFGPLSQDGRLNAWSKVAAEQDLFERVGMAGDFPALDGGDGVAITIDNAGGNKIDPFLQVTTDYRATGGATGSTGVVTVTLINSAPPSGLPNYVIGNSSDLPLGTNRMFFSVYTALPVTAATMAGAPIGFEIDTSLGWNVASAYLEIPPGETRTVVLDLAGQLTAVPYSLATRTQPMAGPQSFTASLG